MIENIAWLILRICFATMFIFPLRDLLKDFHLAVDLTRIVVPFCPRFFAVVMMLVMAVGAASILLGVYAQVAGLMLFVYCLLGVVVHYRLAARIATIHLQSSASDEDKARLEEAVTLGVAGNKTSGQKNIVLAALACFFMLVGSGPLSVTQNLF